MDQGLQALQRQHAAAGNAASGNADADTLKYSQGLADQSYGNYVSRLQPYLQLAGSGATTAAAGQAGAATGLGTGLSSNFTNLGGATNADYAAQGQAANANYTGQGASNAAATMNNYQVGANQLNAITGALGFLSGGAGGGGGGFGAFGGGGGGGGSSGGAGGMMKNASTLFGMFA